MPSLNDEVNRTDDGTHEVHEVILDADGVPLSGLLARPCEGSPSAVVLAVHGGGMSAGYFDNRAWPGLSLLELGARLGFTVLAVDRPGYRASAPHLSHGQSLAQQSVTLRAALADFARSDDVGAGFFIVGHSNGGKLALAVAADGGDVPLLGLDISGLGCRLAVDQRQLPSERGPGEWRRHWGSLRLYPPDAFSLGRALVSPIPALEAQEGPRWPDLYPGIAGRVQVPIRFTFAEQERWWRHDDEAIRLLLEPLTATRAQVDRQPGAGHNISLGWAARTYHLRALAFLEECLLSQGRWRTSTASASPRSTGATVPSWPPTAAPRGTASGHRAGATDRKPLVAQWGGISRSNRQDLWIGEAHSVLRPGGP